MTNLVSIIMPAYNAERTIPQAIESILCQTYTQWELIVVDDASTDGTGKIVQGYAARDSRIHVLCREENRGVSEARNLALQSAGGQWIALLDSDDAWHPEKLEKQLALAAAKDSQLVFTGSGYMDADGTPLSWTLRVPETVDYRRLLKQNVISNSSALVRKSLYERCQVIADEAHEDFCCWLTCLRSGIVAHGIDEPLLIYRLSPGSKSGNKLRSARMAWNSYRIMGLSLPAAAYYMLWYTVTGVLKHRHLRTGKGQKS